MTSDKNLSTENRRSAIRRASGLFLGLFAAATAARASTDVNIKKPVIKDMSSVDPRVLIQTVRENFGLDLDVKITGDVIEGKESIGDALAQETDPEEISQAGVRVQDKLHKLVIHLMQTGRYEHENQVTMKIILRNAEQELTYVMGSLQYESMTADVARLKLRTSIHNFLEQLEQLPAL